MTRTAVRLPAAGMAALLGIVILFALAQIGELSRHAIQRHGWEACRSHAWICEYDEGERVKRMWDCGTKLIFVDLIEEAGRWAFVVTNPAGVTITAFECSDPGYIVRALQGCVNPYADLPPGVR